MITKEQKDLLSKLNGTLDSRKDEKIREGVSEMYSQPDELAILRKAVACLFDIIAALHQGEINNAEFTAYHEAVEAIKAEAKKEIEVLKEA